MDYMDPDVLCPQKLNLSLSVRQQAIAWANVEPDLCPHMALLGHSQDLMQNLF